MDRVVRAAAVAIAAGIACASPQGAETGDVHLIATLESALSGGHGIPVALVWIHVYGASAKGKPVDQWYRASGAGGQYLLTLSKIDGGSYLAHGRAYASASSVPTDVPDFESVGDVGFVVTSKTTTPVSLTLQQNTTKWPPDAVHNFAPVIDSLVASTSTVDSSDSATPISFRASTSDRDGPGDISGWAWSATYAPALDPGQAPGIFSTPGALQTTWSPPSGYEGTVTIAFTVTDRKLAQSSVSVALAVSKRFGAGGAKITAEINNSPDLLSLTTTDGELEPGETTSVTVVALDPDGDDLHYAWDDGACGGSFGSPERPTTDYQAGPSELACPITVTVTDFRTRSPFDARGAATQSTLTINVFRLPPRYAPEFVFAAWSGAPDVAVPPGTSMSFSVDAIQMEGMPLAAVPVAEYQWDDGVGGVFAPVSGTDHRNVTWSTPACASRTTAFVVDVTVTAVGSAASGGLTTPLTFPVTVACP